MCIITRTTGSAVLVTTLLLVGTACGSNRSSSSEFCSVVEKYQDFDGDAVDPGEVEATLRKEFDELKAAAPAEIKDDLVLTWEAMTQSRFTKIDGPDSLEQAQASMNNDEVKAAAERVNEYLVNECGLEEDS